MRLKPAMFLLAPAATLVLLGMSATARLNQPHKSVVDFARDVRPILSDKCCACHGPDDKHRLGGFRLDLREGARRHIVKAKHLRWKPTADQHDVNSVVGNHRLGVATRSASAHQSSHSRCSATTRPL